MNATKLLYCVLTAALLASGCSRRNPYLSEPPIDSLSADNVPMDTGVPEPEFYDNMPNALREPEEEEKVFGIDELQPTFPGGNAALYDFISKNLRMPGRAKAAGISGRVFLAFAVETDGTIADIQVLKGLGFGCDEEAVRVIASMPKWNPAEKNGKVVRVRYTLPVTFGLEK